MSGSRLFKSHFEVRTHCENPWFCLLLLTPSVILLSLASFFLILVLLSIPLPLALFYLARSWSVEKTIA